MYASFSHNKYILSRFLILIFYSVQLRTTPMDSTGVPHILEHTVLCGSQRFPCRDPFFKMLNRSLSTFMNAFTGTSLCVFWLCVCKFFARLITSIFLRSEWLHNVSVLDPECQRLPEPSVCLSGCCFLPLSQRTGLLVNAINMKQEKLCHILSLFGF